MMTELQHSLRVYMVYLSCGVPASCGCVHCSCNMWMSKRFVRRDKIMVIVIRGCVSEFVFSWRLFIDVSFSLCFFLSKF